MMTKDWHVTRIVLLTALAGVMCVGVSCKKAADEKTPPAAAKKTPEAAPQKEVQKEAQPGIQLQFRPTPGEKQTMQVNSKLSTTHPGPTGQDCTEHITNYTVEVEPTAIADDGTVTVRIGILGILQDSHRNSDGLSFWYYDSSKDPHRYNEAEARYSAAIGESFTVLASARGEITELRLDEFFAAVAANRVKYEDGAYRHMPGGRKAEEIIRELNEKYGSPEKRKDGYKKEAAESPFFGPDRLRLLVSNALVPLAREPVKAGADWKGPIMISIEYPTEMAGAYTLKSVENKVCTIEAQAARTPQDKLPEGPARRWMMGSKLGGTYRATLKVDRATGALLSRQAVMNLTGSIFMPGNRSAGPEGDVPVTTVATTTVEIVK